MAGTTYDSDYLVEYHDGSWTALDNGDVLAARTTVQMGLADNGVAFGDEVTTEAEIEVILSAVLSLTVARLPVRITYTIDSDTDVNFVGEVKAASGDLDATSWQCESMLAALPGRTRGYYSPLRYRRPPATKTTAASVEDPDDGSYAGGLINELFWRAGGRPFEQAGSYPNAVFYYSCHQAIRAPDYTWVAGENGYDQVLLMCQAVGGQIYQDVDGVIYYKQPLTYVGSVAATYTIAHFKTLAWEMAAGDQYALSFQMSYTPRRARATQEVINDTTYRTIEANGELTVDLEPHWPIVEDSWVLDGGTLKDKNIIITFFDGALAPYHATDGWTATVATAAMRITIVITNHTGRHMQISKIVVQGQPVEAGETETITVGSGEPTRVLPDNEFVQSKAHAEALATMALSFYGTARAVRTLSEVVYNPSRRVGDTVALTVSELGLSAAPHIVLEKSDPETGAVMELKLVDATGLPQLSDYWLIASMSQSGTKKVAW